LTSRNFIRLTPGDIDEALLLFGIDIVVQGIKASSATTYIRTIMSAYTRRGTPISSPLVGDCFKILEMIACEEEVDHAVDIEEDEAWDIIAQLEGTVKLAAWFMLVIGARCADLAHLQSQDIRFEVVAEGDLAGRGRMSVSFRWTKNHRGRSDRYTIHVYPKVIISELRALFVSRGRLFNLAPQVADLNKALKNVCKTEGVTSYSLRRLFVQSVIKEKTSGDVTNWIEVIKITGHHALKVVRNSYTKPFQNTL
jgi:hypothetical protein